MKKTLNEELKRLSVNEFKSSEKNPVILVLDNVRSAYNVGSVFRTADAFTVQSIYLCGITPQPPHREILKTSLGATESVEWKYFKNTVDAIIELQENNFVILGLEQADESLMLEDFKGIEKSKTAFVFGNEVNGISNEAMQMLDQCIEIPQFGTKHSFNISVSAGIVLWHYYMNSVNKIK